MWDIRQVALAAACIVHIEGYIDTCQCILDSYPWITPTWQNMPVGTTICCYARGEYSITSTSNCISTGRKYTDFLKPLMCAEQINSVPQSEYHGCWCPGSLRRQDISTHGIDYVEYGGHGRVFRTTGSLWGNILSLKASPCKGSVILRVHDFFGLNSLRPSDANMRHQPMPSLVQIMASRLAGDNPLSEPMLDYC